MTTKAAQANYLIRALCKTGIRLRGSLKVALALSHMTWTVAMVIDRSAGTDSNSTDADSPAWLLDP